MNEITFGKKSLTNSFHSSSLFLFQRIKYWELDYACSLCWPFFQCNMASSHMGSANQRGYTSLFSRQRHFYHNNQVISSYLCIWKVASILCWIPAIIYKYLNIYRESDLASALPKRALKHQEQVFKSLDLLHTPSIFCYWSRFLLCFFFQSSPEDMFGGCFFVDF